MAHRHGVQRAAGHHAAAHPLLLEITKLSLVPFGNEAIHVDELYPESNALLSAGGSLLNIIWLVLFGWWLCLSHIAAGIVQCVSIIGIPVGIANFKIAAIALWPVGAASSR